MKLPINVLIAAGVLCFCNLAHTHNVWCHGSCGNPKTTVEFYHRAGEVYNRLSQMERVWQEANSHLENGVIAEFESKINPRQRLKPQEFEKALKGYKKLKEAMEDYDKAIQDLQQVDTKCDKVAIHESVLGRVLREGQPLPRLSRAGVRYADAANLPKEDVSSVTNTTTILNAWRTDLKVLMSTLDEVIVGLRDAIPLAKKGEFAAVMLSGRNAFGDKMPQFTDMYSAYQRLYVRTVMATITTTMQVYPAGYQWLTASPEKGK